MNDLTPEFQILKKGLEADYQRLKNRIRVLRAQDPFSDPNRANDNAASDTEATEESDHDRAEALVAELEAQLSQVIGALQRLETNSYGICVICSRMIEMNRLKILPTAIMCSTCEKTQQERQ
ncbi:hypothetical protein A2154_01980 [Candidatus Gottesmanbacteria bacterium RBG_16_43_7]|uniref:Zinc finger DksA/TraR C4-type domain-containing protein n=1 Tax=Candidatus Gottesmanbacteria bacterium RBG_16_43_7 TaxID=1798373 RepID=A0A1F5Z8C7_9BACT|nr:MAG: hypothetical protein A2154_01980 [Candidatus Gottesmanbacteria bacterium RBG_16_43_7]